MAVSKKVGEQNSEVAPAEASGIDVSKESGAAPSQRGIEHEGMSKAQYYRALLISAALAILALICLIAVIEGIDSGHPAADD
jgi:hypothetical protein